MKKVLLSLVVILGFAFYAFGQKDKEGQANEVGVLPLPTPADTGTPISDQNIPAQTNPPASPGKYRDGEYTGDSADAYYGNVQVKVVISGGKISDVQFLDYPRDRRTSQLINSQAMPFLKQEAIQAQNANVDIISGATATSEAFRQSLQSALSKAI